MDDLLGGIIGIMFLVGAVMLIIYIIIYIAFAVAAVVAAVGTAYGLIVSVVNFFRSFYDVIGYRKALKRCKDQERLEEIEKELRKPEKLRHYSEKYEDVASASYLLGPCFEDIKMVITDAFEYNFESLPEFGRGEEWYSKIFFFVYALCKSLALYGLGTIFTLALSFVFAALCLGAGVIIYPVMLMVFLCEKIYYKWKKISMRCPKCKNSYTLPIYACPYCGIRHVNLRPGRLGIVKRKCVCGTILPLTANAKGIRFETDPESGYVSRKKFNISEMEAYCPECGTQHNAVLTHPIGIALIGGASAGKTTFKVAFLRGFWHDGGYIAMPN